MFVWRTYRLWLSISLFLWQLVYSGNCPMIAYETIYRPLPNYHYEPRLERPWLWSLESAFLAGSTFHAYSSRHCKETLAQYLATQTPHSSFRCVDLSLSFIQTFVHGIFVECDALLLRSLSLKQPLRKPITVNHMGDTRFLLGWTHNDCTLTETLDFIDYSVALELCAPSSNSISQRRPFSTGFNHHWGLGGKLWCSFGIFDWVTMGGWASVLGFFKQSTTPTPGLVSACNVYVKADHAMCNLSTMIGYSYEHKAHDHGNAYVKNAFNSQESTRHVIHALLEWDGQTCDHPHRPRIQLNVNGTIGGTNIINISTGGLFIGFDATWRY